MPLGPLMQSSRRKTPVTPVLTRPFSPAIYYGSTSYPWSSASRFLFMSLVILCCAASCFANSVGTLETGLLEISLRVDQPNAQRATVSANAPCLRSYITSSSSFDKNVIAVPCFPARPVRPIRWM